MIFFSIFILLVSTYSFRFVSLSLSMSARSLIVNRRFLCTNSLIWLTCCSSVDVDGRPGFSKSSTRTLPSLKSLYYLLTFFCDMVKSPKAFCNILNVSATEISFRKQNLMGLLCSTNWNIVQIEKNIKIILPELVSPKSLN